MLPRLLLLTTLPLLIVACGPKIVRNEIFASDDREVVVSLRHVLRGGEPIEHGYTHPVTISDVRIAHILAQIQFQDADENTRAAIRNRHVYPLAAGLSKALASAGVDDEVIAEVYLVDRRFGIFTVEKVTALRMFFERDVMKLEFFAIDEQVKEGRKGGRSAKSFELPLELPKGAQFKVLPSIKQEQNGPLGVAVDWRDPYFGKPVSVSGRGLRRRTILMEAEQEEDRPPVLDAPVFTERLRDAQLDALDALDSERRAGKITESEFKRRRRLVLEGRLEEAGFGASTEE